MHRYRTHTVIVFVPRSPVSFSQLERKHACMQIHDSRTSYRATEMEGINMQPSTGSNHTHDNAVYALSQDPQTRNNYPASSQHGNSPRETASHHSAAQSHFGSMRSSVRLKEGPERPVSIGTGGLLPYGMPYRPPSDGYARYKTPSGSVDEMESVHIDRSSSGVVAAAMHGKGPSPNKSRQARI